MGKRGRKPSSRYTITKRVSKGVVTHWRVLVPTFDRSKRPVPGQRTRHHFDISIPRREIEQIAQALYLDAIQGITNTEYSPRMLISACLQYYREVSCGSSPKAPATIRLDWFAIRDLVMFLADRLNNRHETPSSIEQLLGSHNRLEQEANLEALQSAADLPLEEVGNELIQQYRAYLARRFSASGANMRLRHLKSMFSWMVETDSFGLERNPIRGKDLFQAKRKTVGARVDPNRKRHYTTAEIRTIVNSLQGNQDCLCMVKLLFLTGARFGEIYRLQHSDYNPSDGLLHIPQGKTTDHTIVLFPALTCAIEDWIESGSKWRFGDTYYSKAFRRTADQLGIQIAQPLHGFRHSLVSALTLAGISRDDIGKWIGHSQAGGLGAGVTSIYDHTQLEALRRVAAAIPVPWE